MTRTLRVTTVLVFLGVACRTVVEPQLPEPHAPQLAAQPLSHAACVDLALRSVPNHAGWQARLLAAKAQVRAAGTLPNPRLNASWEDFGIGGAAHPVQQTFGIAFALEALLARGRREAAATHQLAAEIADLRAEQVLVAVAVAKAYDRLCTDRLRVALRREGLVMTERGKDALAKFVEAGLEAKVALDRAAVEAARARAEVARAQAQERLDEIELAFALGFARPVALQLSEPMTPADTIQIVDLQELLRQAAVARPELAAAQERYAAELERAHLQAAGLRFLPTATFGPRIESGEVRGVASLDVELPIFDSGSAADAAQNATLLASAAEARRQAQKVASEVAMAVERHAGAAQLVVRELDPLAAARRGIREQLERLFAAGEVSFFEVITARRDEIEAALDALAARAALSEACLDLDAALGRVRVSQS